MRRSNERRGSRRGWATTTSARSTVELLRIIGEMHGARAMVEPVRRAAEQSSGRELAPKVFSGVTVRLAAILDDARSPSDNDVLAAMLDEDSNLAVIVLDRLGVPLDE